MEERKKKKGTNRIEQQFEDLRNSSVHQETQAEQFFSRGGLDSVEGTRENFTKEREEPLLER